MSGIRGILASLSIKLSADSAELDRDLEKAKKGARDWGNETKAAAMNVGAAMGAAAVAMGAAMTAMANKALENMDRQAEFASSISVSVEQLTRLQYAAKMSGVEQEALNNGLKTLVKNSSEAAQGLGKSVGAFNELGLSAAKMNELSPDKQFLLLADAMKTVENANDRTRIAIKMFGDEGAAMVNMLMQGQDGLKQLADASDAAGYTVTQSQAAMAAAAGDAKDAMSVALDGVSNQLAMQLGPAITNAATWIAEKLPMAIDFVKAAFFGLRLVVSNVFDTITGIIAGMGGSITSLILTPFEKITQGLAYALSILGSDSAASVQSVADNMTAARETADHYAQAFTRIGEAYDANQKAYDDAIDGMAQEQAARQEQLNATKAATMAVAEYVGVNKTKAESDREAAEAAKAHAEAEAEKAKTLKLTLDESAKALAAEGEAELARQQAAKDASLQNAQGMISGIGGLDAVGSDPMAQAQSEWVGKQAALQWMLEQEQITRDEYGQLLLDAELQKEQAITQIRIDEAARRAQFESMSAGQQTAFVLGQMQTLTAGLAQHSKKAFEVNKAAGIANAIINTYQGVTNALAAYPPPISFIMAGAQLAAGLAQVNAIKSTKFGGGTTPSLAGSTPTYNGVPVTAGNSQNTGEASGNGPMKVEIVTTVIGSDPNAVATELSRQLENKTTLRKVITGISEVVQSEDLTLLPASSRNAQDLATRA